MIRANGLKEVDVMSKWAATFLVVVGSSWLLVAQQPAAISMSPVPFWTDDAALGATERDGDVFYDLKTNEVVLRSGSTSGSSPAYRRYRVHHQPDPEIQFAVKQEKGGDFTYTYRVIDSKSEEPITSSVSIMLPGGDAELDPGGGWPSKREGTASPDRISLRTLGTMDQVTWTNPKPESRAAAELQLASRRLPGLTDIVADPVAKSDLSESVLSSLVPEDRNKVEWLLAHQRRRIIVLAPLFSPDTDKRMIGASFHHGISRLAGNRLLDKHRLLDKESRFVSDMLSLLEIAATTGVAPVSQIAALEASEGIEQQLRSAVLLALE
jgi:hypothetical protein